MAANGRGQMRPNSSGRTPPFVIIGLLVVIGILAFNYWNLTSKNAGLSSETEDLGIKYRSALRKVEDADKLNNMLKQEHEHFKGQSKAREEECQNEKNNNEREIYDVKNKLDNLAQEIESTKNDLNACDDEVGFCHENMTRQMIIHKNQLDTAESRCRLQLEDARSAADQKAEQDEQYCAESLEQKRLEILQAVQQLFGVRAIQLLQEHKQLDITGIDLSLPDSDTVAIVQDKAEAARLAAQSPGVQPVAGQAPGSQPAVDALGQVQGTQQVIGSAQAPGSQQQLVGQQVAQPNPQSPADSQQSQLPGQLPQVPGQPQPQQPLVQTQQNIEQSQQNVDQSQQQLAQPQQNVDQSQQVTEQSQQGIIQPQQNTDQTQQIVDQSQQNIDQSPQNIDQSQQNVPQLQQQAPEELAPDDDLNSQDADEQDVEDDLDGQQDAEEADQRDAVLPQGPAYQPVPNQHGDIHNVAPPSMSFNQHPSVNLQQNIPPSNQYQQVGAPQFGYQGNAVVNQAPNEQVLGQQAPLGQQAFGAAQVDDNADQMSRDDMYNDGKDDEEIEGEEVKNDEDPYRRDPFQNQIQQNEIPQGPSYQQPGPNPREEVNRIAQGPLYQAAANQAPYGQNSIGVPSVNQNFQAPPVYQKQESYQVLDPARPGAQLGADFEAPAGQAKVIGAEAHFGNEQKDDQDDYVDNKDIDLQGDAWNAQARRDKLQHF